MSASGAWIVDVKLFSNVSVCFNFEVPTSQVKRLRDALTATDLHFTTDSAASFASAVDRKSADSQAADTAGSLQITFVHNEPDLRIEVPQIPG